MNQEQKTQLEEYIVSKLCSSIAQLEPYHDIDKLSNPDYFIWHEKDKYVRATCKPNIISFKGISELVNTEGIIDVLLVRPDQVRSQILGHALVTPEIQIFFEKKNES